MVENRTKLKIIVPTWNSARYIDIILSYYRDNAIDVVVYVDTKSTDGTRGIAQEFFEVADMANESHVIETVIDVISRDADAEWILRIDDDELPTLAMMTFVMSAVTAEDADEVDVFAFPRHQCLVSKDGQLFAHAGHSATADHLQWRLYRPDRVRYAPNLHTPGFSFERSRSRIAPDDACMVHLDWVVHDYGERKAKLARYANILPDRSARDLPYYLFEDAPLKSDDLVALDFPEFAEVARRLSARMSVWAGTCRDVLFK